MQKHTNITVLKVISLLLIVMHGCQTSEYNIKNKFKEQTIEVLKTSRPNLAYDSVVPECVYANLDMPGTVKRSGVYGERKYGMLVRTLRFQNITRKVEKKYGLPENLLLAMMMQESGGADLLPNSGDDGGLGLIHMQPKLAKEFGLKTYQDCDKLVSREHGEALRALITQYKFDKKQLIAFDDRFHPILNIDAAGRMLAYYAAGKQFQDTPLKTAIYRYAGSKNYQKYYENILLFLGQLSDKELLADLENYFNETNPTLTINGKKADFDAYIKSHQKQNINYGLKKYK